MTVHQLEDPRTPIGEVLEAAGTDGVVLDAGGPIRYAVIPLDDDLIDYLVERSPRFMEVCQKAREDLRAGRFRTHDDVRKMLEGD